VVGLEERSGIARRARTIPLHARGLAVSPSSTTERRTLTTGESEITGKTR
jgi:hypothetical protein